MESGFSTMGFLARLKNVSILQFFYKITIFELSFDAWKISGLSIPGFLPKNHYPLR